METLSLRYTADHKALRKFGLFILICILVLHGTHIRVRTASVAPTMDWLVFARLLTCAIGFLVGIILLPRKVAWGFGAKVVLLYVLAAGASALNSPYSRTAVGYVILLSGASALMLALVYHARNVAQLEMIERIWLLTVGVLVVKDALTGLLFPELRRPGSAGRLGMGVTHATLLSLLAGLLFWMSFTSKRNKYAVILWPWRAFLLYVIIAAVSRVSIAAFIIGGLCYVLFRKTDYLNRWMVVFSCVGILVTVFALGLSFGQSWANGIASYLRRGQDIAALATFTHRTEIWRNAAKQSLESPIIGHGYGVSRLVLPPMSNKDFKAMHCHNEVLEVSFATGILGLIPFVAMSVYSLSWITRSSRLRRTFSTGFTLHAICLVAVLLISSLFETRISGRLTPIQPLFFLYLFTLDREKHFAACTKPTNTVRNCEE